MEKEKEEMKTVSYQYGNRAPIRDRILEIMSDGAVRKTKEIEKAANWPTKTNILKTLADLKVSLIENRDHRRLKKFKPDNCRKGVDWQLITTKN